MFISSTFIIYGSVSYCDSILGMIPATFLPGPGALNSGGLAVETAALVASLAAVTLVGHAPFVRGPVDSGR